MKTWLFLLSLSVACNNTKDTQETGLAPEDTGESSADTGDSGDTDLPDPVVVTDLAWSLHEDIQSLVYVTWQQSAAAAVTIEYGFEGEGWLQAPTVEAAAGANQQLILGIPFDEAAAWRVTVEGGDSVDGEDITTGPVPEGLPVPEVTVSESREWLPDGNYLLASINQQPGGWTGGHYWTFILDRAGRPVWANKTPLDHWTLFAQVAQNGDHILWDDATAWSDYDDGAGSTVHSTYLDSEIEVIATPGLHHAFVQLPDETLVWGSQYHGGKEALVSKAPGAEDETIIWTCQDDWPGSGFCESNGLFYSPERDTFLYSFYTNNSIVEVDHATGESLWWAGDVRNGYSFIPPESQYSWQHGISYTDTGTLLVSTAAQRSTMVREYAIDHDALTLTEVWSFDPGVFADTNGDAWRLSNGNTLHLIGSASEIVEVTADGEEVWRLDYHSTRLLGRGEFIESLYDLVADQGYSSGR